MRGGKRPNSGLKQLRPKELKITLKMSKKVNDTLNRYSESTGISKSDLVDAILSLQLHRENRDFIHCPGCGEPLAYAPIIPATGLTEFTCKCGHEFKAML